MNELRQFEMADTPAGPASALFQREMEKMFSVGLAVSAPDEKPFQTQMTAYCGRQLRFAALRFSPHTTSSMHVGQRASRLLVTLQKQGVALVNQDGRESRIEPGDMFMIDPSRPFCIETGDILTHSVYLEPEALRGVVPELDTLTARAISGNGGAGALFRSVLDETFALAPTLDEDTADRIADALPHVWGVALGALGAAACPPSRLRLLHRQRILAFARANLRKHDLDAAAVAHGVNLSTRYVYELFAGEDLPLMKWVWGKRLERCHADLATAALQARSIGEIAYHWGFNNLAHFSRAFRQAYGQSPREFRNLHIGRATH